VSKGSMKSMGHWIPICPLAAHKLSAAVAAASGPQVNFVSSQMETLQKILESNGIYGPPPKQSIHNGQLRAGLRSLCKYTFDRKDYLNQETKMKQNEILATFTRSTKKMERKPDENTNVDTNGSANANRNANAVLISSGINPRKAKPAPQAPLLDKTCHLKIFQQDQFKMLMQYRYLLESSPVKQNQRP
jgi:hypothetical protein